MISYINIKAPILSILLCFAFNFSIAQNPQKIDSLNDQFSIIKHDTSKVILWIELADVYRKAQPDTAFYYLKQAINLCDLRITSKGIQEKIALKYIFLKANSLKLYGVVYRFQYDYDNAFTYYHKALSSYYVLAQGKDTMYIRLGKTGLANCYTLIGQNYNYQGDYDEAIVYFERAAKLAESLKDLTMLSSSYNNIGNVHSDQGRFDKASEFFHKALEIKERLGDKFGIANCYNNMGIVQWNQRNHNKSIDYFKMSLKIFEELGEKKNAAGSNNNIGNILADKANYKEALPYYQKATELYEMLKDKRGLYNCYNNLGIVYAELGQHDKAIDFYNKSLNICLELEDKGGLTMIYGSMASLFVKIADSIPAQKSQNLKKAIDFGTLAFDIAVEIGALPWQSQASQELIKAYELAGNSAKALFYAKELLACKDSMFSEEKTTALTEMQTKYESDKKQLEIDKLAQEKELDQQTILVQQAENRKQLILIISVLAGFIIVLFFSIVVYRMFRHKKQANYLLQDQNEEIRQQKEELESQRDEIESQRDQVVSQKDQIEQLYDIAIIRKNIVEKQKQEIDDSIRYALRIQSALLPTETSNASALGSHFIFFRPKDVVSGDFYWVQKKENRLIIALADCTGHGVPGAFMSMLGISFLNEINRYKEVKDAADLLNQLRVFVVDALKQSNVHSSQKDGMDMSIAVIDTVTNHCSWAGANRNLFIIPSDKQQFVTTYPGYSDKETESHGISMFELKGDKMPVAIHVHMEDFTNYDILLKQGDKLYFFTDGYVDQFGGKNGRKFLNKPFKDLLLRTSSLEMHDQGLALEKEFDAWIGTEKIKYPQVDDITVLGIKI